VKEYVFDLILIVDWKLDDRDFMKPKGYMASSHIGGAMNGWEPLRPTAAVPHGRSTELSLTRARKLHLGCGFLLQDGGDEGIMFW
jgi:hypothetical protein